MTRPQRLLCALFLTIAAPADAASGQGILRPHLVSRLRVPDSLGLAEVQEIAVAPDGSVVILGRRRAQLFVFEPAGLLRATLGRLGAGPGEFRLILSFGWVGDSLWALDPALQRTTFFTSAGRLIRSEAWPRFEPRRASIGLFPEAVLPGGCLLLPESVQPIDSTYVRNTGRKLYRQCPVAGSVDTIASLSYRDPWLVVTFPANRGRYQRTQPWTDMGRYAVAADGGHVALVERIESSDDRGRYEVRLLSSEGSILWQRNFRYDPVRLTPKVINAMLSPLVRGLRRAYATEAQARSALLESLHTPKYLPPVKRVLIGRDDTVWLERFTDDANHEWEVLDSKGVLRARVQVPGGIELYAVSLGEVWGLELDANDVPLIGRYRLATP